MVKAKILLVKCLALWGERERNGRHYSRQTVQHSVQQPCRSLPFEQSNADRNRLDRECCHSHLVASLLLLARAGIRIRERCVAGADPGGALGAEAPPPPLSSRYYVIA